MANIDAPRGFTPKYIAGLSPSAQQVTRYYKGTTAGVIGIGDPVIRIGTTSATDGVPEIQQATAGAAISGVVVAFDPDVSNLDKKRLESADTGYVYVADHPDQVFEVQEVSGGTPLAMAQIGNHIDSTAAADASSVTGRSVAELDNAAVAADNTWIVVGKSRKAGNELGEHCKWLVKANLHTERNNSASSVDDI